MNRRLADMVDDIDLIDLETLPHDIEQDDQLAKSVRDVMLYLCENVCAMENMDELGYSREDFINRLNSISAYLMIEADRLNDTSH